jgi:hypothetical protein
MKRGGYQTTTNMTMVHAWHSNAVTKLLFRLKGAVAAVQLGAEANTIVSGDRV